MGCLLLVLVMYWIAQCRGLYYDLARDTPWLEEVATTYCYSIADGEILLQPGCYAASMIGDEVLSTLKSKESTKCPKFANGEFFQLVFSLRREDAPSCAQIRPPSILTNLIINDQPVLEAINEYNAAKSQSFSFLALVEAGLYLDVAFASIYQENYQESLPLLNQSCFSGIVLSDVHLHHIPQPCKADSVARDVSSGVLTAPGAASEEEGVGPTDACTLLGTPDAVILHKVHVSPQSSNAPLRVFCGVYTTATEHSARIRTMRATWGHKCTSFLAFSTATDPAVPAVYVPHIGEEKYANMWQKIRSIWKYIYTHYSTEYDYFLLCGDDTYYIMENLHAYLNSAHIQRLKSLDQGLFIGRRFHGPAEHNYTIFNSGGAGYLLDQRALQLLASRVDSAQCRANVINEAFEDVNVARCLASADPPVVPIDTRDTEFEQQFHAFSPGVSVLYQPSASPPTLEEDWYHHYDPHIRYGMQCCSAHSISFHYVSPQEMELIDHYLYRCAESVKKEYYAVHGPLYFERYRKYGQLAR